MSSEINGSVCLGMVVAAMLACQGGASAADEKTIFRGVQSENTIIDALKPRVRAARPADTPNGDVEMASMSLMILFPFNSAKLTPTARAQLDQVAAAMQSSALRSFSFLVEGYTDASGSDNYNLRLSQQRADAVQAYLVGVDGVDPSRLRAEGRGETELFRPDEPLAEENRRVRFVNLGA